MAAKLALISYVVLGVVLCISAGTDLKTGKVYNWLTLPAILLGFALAVGGGALMNGQPGAVAGLKDVSLAFALGLVPFVVIFAAGGLGGGDVKLMATVGAVSAQWQVVLGTAFYAFAVGMVMAVVLMIRRRIVKQTLGRVFTAALTAAAGVKPSLPGDSPRIPFALCICLGGLLAGAEKMLHVNLPWSGWLY